MLIRGLASLERVRYNSAFGDTNACEAFQEGTDTELEGIWYHATSQQDAIALASGQKRFESNSGKLKADISLTRDPRGAAGSYSNWQSDDWVIRVRVRAKSPLDRYRLEAHALTNGFDWLHISDVRQIMVEKGSCRRREDPDVVPPHSPESKDTGISS